MICQEDIVISYTYSYVQIYKNEQKLLKNAVTKAFQLKLGTRQGRPLSTALLDIQAKSKKKEMVSAQEIKKKIIVILKWHHSFQV